jgi:hypothetical protein
MSKAKPKPKMANRRAALRALERIAAREAVCAFYAAVEAVGDSKEMKSLALARRIRSGTMLRITRQAFEYATSGGAGNWQKFAKSAVPPLPYYLRLPIYDAAKAKAAAVAS